MNHSKNVWIVKVIHFDRFTLTRDANKGITPKHEIDLVDLYDL